MLVTGHLASCDWRVLVRYRTYIISAFIHDTTTCVENPLTVNQATGLQMVYQVACTAQVEASKRLGRKPSNAGGKCEGRIFYRVETDAQHKSSQGTVDVRLQDSLKLVGFLYKDDCSLPTRFASECKGRGLNLKKSSHLLSRHHTREQGAPNFVGSLWKRPGSQACIQDL
jgi:hypothetical protein